MATAQIKCVVHDDMIYPASSDEPLKDGDIQWLELTRLELFEGDIVIDAYGAPFRITTDFPFIGPVAAFAVDHPATGGYFIDQLTAPLTRIYHCGEPRHDVVL